MEDQDDKTEMAVLTAEIVAAYVGNNVVPVSELPTLIKDVHTAMALDALRGRPEGLESSSETRGAHWFHCLPAPFLLLAIPPW